MTPQWVPGTTEGPDHDLSTISNLKGTASCYFMVVDILGFSQMILNLTAEARTQRVEAWLAMVHDLSEQLGINNIQLISDTLFVREEDSSDGLARLLKFARLLLEHGLDRLFPLRGAIVHGNAAWGNLTYGEAVIRAHRLERSLDWIGVACEPTLPAIGSMLGWDVAILYPVPKKAGLTQLIPAVSWEIPQTEELLRRATGGGSLAKGDTIKWDIVSKVERTIQFRLYLRLGPLLGLDPQRYKGAFPMHFIEALMEAASWRDLLAD